jgi:outer membrane protein OmpA-like peptidoglycan-associated protein/flagellar hook assembly protein FlgD
MNRILCALLAVTFMCAREAAAGGSAKKIFLFGDSSGALGRAGTGVSLSGVDLFYLNPASIGDLERTGLSLQYGTPPLPTGFNNGNASLAVPTSYGVFGASARCLFVPGSPDFRTGYGAAVGMAKNLIPELLFGFSFTFFASPNHGGAYYAGGNIGFIYKFHNTGSKYGFGLLNPRMGLSVNAGYPFGRRKKYADFNAVSIGYGFTFFSIRNFNLSFFNDATVLNYREYPVKLGLESGLFDILTLRFGYIIPHAYNDGAFTAGLGLKLGNDAFKASLNYAINFYPRMKFVHYLGLTCEYGAFDREPPRTAIHVEHRYISPNHDGADDYALFHLDVTDRSRIKGWRLQILDSSNRIVKDYAVNKRDLVDTLDFVSFFERLFQKRESRVVPETIIWDGTDAEGNLLPDGAYAYSFYAWDARGNISGAKTGTIVIDTEAPEVSLDASGNLLSPNGDNQKDQYTVTQKIKTAPGDVWSAGFRDSLGRVVRIYRWEGSFVPGKVTWDGKDDRGSDAPEGLYEYFISCTDEAGNRGAAAIGEITLTRKYKIADVTLSYGYFSFFKDTGVNLFPYLSDARGLEEWRVVISNSKRKIVREIAGNGIAPRLIGYDCKNEKNEKLEDGVYYVRFEARFAGGNTIRSFEKKLVIDSTPPELSVSHSPRLFSPDGDENNDFLKIRLSANDLSGIARWSVTVYSSAGLAFKSFSGKGPVPREIVWDGVGDQRDKVESAAEYFMIFEAEDLAGNMGKSRADRIDVDILVMVTERGLKIRTSNIEFSLGSDEILPAGRSVLERVYEVLRRYEAYDVLIEGYTDDVGREDDNLELSERRAAAVKDYLVRRGITADRLTFAGMGETAPCYPNDSDEHRRLNRRIEFILTKRNVK